MLPPPNDRKYIGVIIVLGIMLLLAGQEIERLRARPEEHTASKAVSSSLTKRDPVKITKRYAPAPPDSKCESVLVEVVEERGAVEIAKESEKTAKTDIVPAKPDFNRVVGVKLDLLDPKKVRDIHAGMVFFRRYEVVYGLGLQGSASQRHSLDLNFRF